MTSQSAVQPNTASRARPLWMVLFAAMLITGIAMGLRGIMGLYLTPMTRSLGIGREPFSDAMAIANLVWGIGAVFTGIIVDRYGAGRVVALGALATVTGTYLMYAAQSGGALYVSGILLGIGIAGTGNTALVGPVGRAAPPEKRASALASLGMSAGIGGFIAFPYTSLLISSFGWQASLLFLLATAAIMLPLALTVAGRPRAVDTGVKPQTIVEAFREALAHPSFLLLTTGFFVCGFHVAFYGVHLPAFAADKGLDDTVAVTALTMVGLSNLAGVWIAGRLGRVMENRIVLSFIYLGRSLVFLALLFVPITPFSLIAISVVLGFLWLSTVPLTSNMVATFFGTTWMSMLFGLVFLSHQIGSFTGLWLAGRLYDATKSYDTMWWISIALGVVAALLNWPIRERPVARLSAQVVAAE